MRAFPTVLPLLVSLTCVVLSSAGSKHPRSYPAHYSPQYPKGPPPSAFEGTPCELPQGYLPYTCEAGTLIESSSEILPVEAHGPNVCRLRDVFLAREEEYVFQQQCAWEYDYHQHTYFYLCFLDCLPSGKCTNSSRNDTRENVYCCEGFTTSPALKPSPVSVLLNQFVVPADDVPPGCPIAQGNTLLQCLEIHGLSNLIEVIMTADLVGLFNSSTDKVTLFAPPNASLENVDLEFEDDAAQFILSHTVQGDVHVEDISYNGELISLYGSEIFTSTVELYYYRPLVYQAPSKGYYHYTSYSQHQGDYLLLETERFVSGARIEVADACAPPSQDSSTGGVLHLVDRPLPHTMLTVADLLEQDPQFSTFFQLLDTFNLLQYLDTYSPYTLFAPINASFDRYAGALECLTLFERDPLNDLLLYHILDAAEYSSTLKARDVVYTKLLQPLVVERGDSEQIFLVDAEDQAVPITQPDLLASNGVVHGIPSLLIPRHFDLGICADLLTMPPLVTSIDPLPSSTMSMPSILASVGITLRSQAVVSTLSSTVVATQPLPSPSLTTIPVLPPESPRPSGTSNGLVVDFQEGFRPN